MKASRFKASAKAFAVHLCASAFVAGTAALLVLGIWFPHPFRDLAGGAHLFWIMVVVDVVCGPVITGVLFNPEKSRRELMADLSLVVVIQLSALLYGLYSISEARPVVLAHEVDRFVAVSKAQLDVSTLEAMHERLHKLSWFRGPQLVGTRSPSSGDEMLSSVEQSIKGLEPSARPDWWQPFTESLPAVRSRMKPIELLWGKSDEAERITLEQHLKETSLGKENLFYLPLVSQKKLDSWIVLLDANGTPVGYAPLGGF